MNQGRCLPAYAPLPGAYDLSRSFEIPVKICQFREATHCLSMVLTPEGVFKLHRTGTHASSLPVGSKFRAADAVCYRTPCPGSTVPRGNPLPCSELGQQQARWPSYGQANIAAAAAHIVMRYMLIAQRPLPPLRLSIMPTAKTITAPTSMTPTN